MQIYADLVDGHRIRVKPIEWQTFTLVDRSYPTVYCEVLESACGYNKGEKVQFAENRLFCIAGHSSYGKIKAVAPDLSKLPKGI